MCHTGKERFANILENKQNKKWGEENKLGMKAIPKDLCFIFYVFFFCEYRFFCSSLLLGLFRYTKACIYLFIV